MQQRRVTADTLSRAILILGLCAVALFLLLSLIFMNKIESAPVFALKFIAAGIVYSAATVFARRLPLKYSIFLRTLTVILFISFLFGAMAPLQHIVVPGWMDGRLISMERSLTGTETTIALQRIVSSVLTEWSMFCYVIYVPFLFITAAVAYRFKGADGLYEYLFKLLCVNIICDIGFILFPVAGPLFHMPEQFTVPLKGGLFTWCGEWMRANVHYPGGNFPSPHCAAGTTMMIAMYRSDRRWFLCTAPIFITIYFSIAYGRYHYISDGIAGGVVALLITQTWPVVASGLAALRFGTKAKG